MLKRINLENFKGFESTGDLALKPITILCGTNSSGKSTILQSILLLKQSLESKNPNQTLLLNGRYVHLGTFDNIIYGKTLDRNITFHFSLKYQKQETGLKKFGVPSLQISFRPLMSDDVRMTRPKEYLIDFKIQLKPQQKGLGISPIVNSFSSSISFISDQNTILPGPKVSINREENGKYKLSWDNIRIRSDSGRMKSGTVGANFEFANLLVSEIDFLDTPKDNDKYFDVLYTIFRINDLIRNSMNFFTYIGPLREEPARRYIYEDETLEIGNKGENAAYLYLSEQDNLIANYFSLKDNSFIKEPSVIKLKDAMMNWLNHMKITDLKPEPLSEIIYLNLASGSSKDTRVNIADVGFGVSQIFPIILEGVRMPTGNTLILEQPEIHLHPNLQMQMADFFISLALANKNIIVETHSDHIINRLIRRIVEDKTYNLKELIGFYFIKTTDKGSVFEEVKIDDNSGILNWPDDFFDQTAKEQEMILRAGLNKHKPS